MDVGIFYKHSTFDKYHYNDVTSEKRLQSSATRFIVQHLLTLDNKMLPHDNYTSDVFDPKNSFAAR